jgi:hypothetical protein
MGAAEVRFSKKNVGITLEAWSHRQQGLARWLAWEKARKDRFAKRGMWESGGEPRV